MGSDEGKYNYEMQDSEKMRKKMAMRAYDQERSWECGKS